MALKVIQRLQLFGQTGAHLCPPIGLGRFSGLLTASAEELLCAACLRTSADQWIQGQGCRKLIQPVCGRMNFSTIAKDPFYTAGSVALHKDSVPRFCLSHLHQPTDGEEKAFLDRLKGCSSSRQVLRLLRTVEIMSDTMAAEALHRVADLEREGHSLKDPAVLEKDPLWSLCCQLEEDSGRLTEAGLVSALLACTRLYLDPWSTLVVRLVSESQRRLDSTQMSLGQLCTLGRALLALEGPGCGMLEQVMEQVQRQEPAQWSPKELTDVYGLLQAGVGMEARYQGLLNTMHSRAVSVSSRMDPLAVSSVLGALVVMNQTQTVPLVISLCKQAVRHIPHFRDEELGMVLGALMHFGHSDHSFVEAMERHVPKTAFTAHPETVTKVIHYLGRRNILSPAVFDAVAESFVYRADDYTTSQVARQIMAFGKLNYLPPNAGEVFRKVEAVLDTRFSHFQPRTLLNLLHSCILVERFPVNFVSKVFNRFFLQQLQEQDTGIDRIVLAQLTQLYMTVKLECPFYAGPRLLPAYHVKSFLTPGRSLETPVDGHLYNRVKNGLVDLLGDRAYFASRVLTPHCYTLGNARLDADNCNLVRYMITVSDHLIVTYSILKRNGARTQSVGFCFLLFQMWR
uniref:FAST kinase domains 3 n=1 Tax=Esox lucius TaxID=8010 RepID=A0A3P8XSB4_ESOLU